MVTREVWDERYRRHRGVFAGEPNAWVDECLPLLPSSARVLCLGDGEGRNSRWLAAHGCRVTAVEWSPVAVARAASDAEGLPVEHVVADVTAWAVTPAASGEWDAVVQVHCPLPGWVSPLRTCLLVADVLDADGVAAQWPGLALQARVVDGLLRAIGRPTQQSEQRPKNSRS